ncbi:MAG: sensor histidine kinase [Lysobacter sp.]|nr:MAG: sensor histidine kinase [Lysobacter sp.]
MNSTKPSLSTLSWLAMAAAALGAVAVAFVPAGDHALVRSGAIGLAALAAALAVMIAVRARDSDRVLQDHADALRRSENERNELQRELERHSQLEQQLRQAKQDAESAVMAKGEFLATMSHEIRTPLNGIVPMLDLLMHNRLPQDQAELVHTAFLSSQQMLRIVDDILDYSKLEASKLQLESTNFNLRETLEAVLQLMERPAQSKGLRLNLTIDPSVRLPVRGDPVRLRQVLSNLLSNAVKFTERGSVSVSVRKIGESSAQHHLRFEVRDTGIGISAAAQGRLFQAFNQADASTTRLYGGTGLGLAISRRIIELMGGRIGVESEHGQGAMFWFEVPLLKVQGDIATPKASDTVDARVLVISGDQRLRLRLNMLLPNWGLRITTVESTQDALERLRSAAAQGGAWAYSTVVADLAGMRNTSVALQRNLERHNVYGNVRLVCLQGDEPAAPELLSGGATLISRTAPDADLRSALLGLPEPRGDAEEFPPSPSPAESERLRIAPVKVENAASAILLGTEAATSSSAPERPAAERPAPARPTTIEPSHEPAASPMAAAAAPTPAATEATSVAAPSAENVPDAPRPLRVLLVEDNPVNLMVGQRLLSVLGTHCDSATNGEAALLRMQASRYDLVLMDCQMPVMDGYTATRRWREHEAASDASRRLPIVAMTANAMAGDRQKCLDAGMDDYLAKPVTRGELERCLFHWQQMAQQGNPQGPDRASIEAAAAAIPTGRLPQAGPALAAAPAAPPPAPPPQDAASTVLDLGILDELRSMLGGEVDRLIEVFLDDTPRLIAALETAAVAPDYDMLRNAAHSLKSSSANLGAVALSNAAKKVEHGARARARWNAPRSRSR